MGVEDEETVARLARRGCMGECITKTAVVQHMAQQYMQLSNLGSASHELATLKEEGEPALW